MQEDRIFVCPLAAGSVPDTFAPEGQDRLGRDGREMHLVLKPSWRVCGTSSIRSDSGRALLQFDSLQEQSEP